MAKSLLAGHSSDDHDEGEGEELKRGGDHPEKIFFRRLLKRCSPFFKAPEKVDLFQAHDSNLQKISLYAKRKGGGDQPEKMHFFVGGQNSPSVPKNMKILNSPCILKLVSVQNTDEITPSLVFLSTLVALHFNPVHDTVGRSFKLA